jgi:hypothetical protein
MENFCNLLQCFGERYINCSNDQAKIDVEMNREALAGAFNAIMDYARRLAHDEQITNN